MEDLPVNEALHRFAQNSRLLALLDEDGLQRLAKIGEIQHFEAGSSVVTQGERGETFYLIAQGEVRVVVSEAGGEVARLGPGMFFGEIGVMTKQPRSATVEATERSELICFYREPVLEVFADYPRVKEVIGSVGLARTEENISTAVGDDAGLAAMLEGDDDVGGLAEALEGAEEDVNRDEDDAMGDDDDDGAGPRDTAEQEMAPGDMSTDVDMDIEMDMDMDIDTDVDVDAGGDDGPDLSFALESDDDGAAAAGATEAPGTRGTVGDRHDTVEMEPVDFGGMELELEEPDEPQMPRGFDQPLEAAPAAALELDIDTTGGQAESEPGDESDQTT